MGIPRQIIAIASTMILMILISLASCGGKNSLPNYFVVKGTLANVEGNYFLAAKETHDKVLVDTIQIDKDGKFIYEGSVDTITVVSLYFNGNSKNTYFLLDKGWKVELQGDVLYPDLIAAKGGNINDDLSKFKKDNEVLIRSRTELHQIIDDNINNKEHDGGKVFADLKNTNFELSNVAAEYVKQNPTKIASVMLINSFFKDESSITRLDEMIALLRGEARLFPLAIALNKYSEKVKQSDVGALAPGINIKDTKGKETRLIDYRGKYVVLNFASSKCGVCALERKAMVELYTKLQKENRKDVDFLTVMINHESTPLLKASQDSVKWKILPDMGGWAANSINNYNINEIPYTILIDKKGYIKERNMTFKNLVQTLEDIKVKE